MSYPHLNWREILRNNFTDWISLADFLELSAEQRREIIVSRRFPLNLPLRLAQKIVKGTLDDPILRQFVPLAIEEKKSEGFCHNPVGDQNCRKTPKLLKKYEGRVLLLCSSACAMHCRFCFRQHFDYEVKEKLFQEELEWIRKDSSIHEVILSGGDPLSLSDAVLGELIHSIDAIPHVKRLRIHSRFPIGIPERLDEGFLKLFEGIRMRLWFVVHTNHPLELDNDVLAALERLQQRGFTLLNQSVLLRGVNDTAEVLSALNERLVDNGIVPYYLHQLDKTQGTAHFEVPQAEGQELVDRLSKSLSGYAVPKYVRELAGEPGKTPIRPLNESSGPHTLRAY